jgi:XTP/dITP diphosphohydrolase
MTAHLVLFLASSNPGKLRELRMLARQHSGGLAAAAPEPAPAEGHVTGRLPPRLQPASGIAINALPGIAHLPSFDEAAPTFAENAAGKALHYSRFTNERVLADDSGLVVPALGGAPGPRSARYAGPEASDADRVRKLLEDLAGKRDAERRARFVCVLAMARAGRVLAVISDAAEGIITDTPRGENGFGYDPVFLFEPLGRTFAELSEEEKNRHSHRGKAFRKLLAFLLAPEEFLLA